jgi:two-component system cell cycle sensor histidine kinase/response regulator CckA
MQEPLRLLHIEDDEDDAELVRRVLEKDGFSLAWERVDSEHQLRQALRQPWDIAISDFAMPGFSGLRAFEMLSQERADLPFIFVSGALGEERAVEAMRAGAKDYFLKGNLARLNAAVRRELREAANRRQRKIAEETAAREQQRLALAIEASNAGVFEMKLDDAGGTVDYSGPWTEILGYRISELPDRGDALVSWVTDRIDPEAPKAALVEMRRFYAGRTDRYNAEIRLRRKNDSWVDVAVFARAVERDPSGAARRIAGVVLDLSARKHLEAQLRQAQKMEAVGRLAGGIAHDFNNLLTAILSFGSFAREALTAEDPIGLDIDEILKAGQRAQALTSQLLAFSRRKPVAPRVLNVNEVIEGTQRILRRLLGEDVQIIVQPAADLGNVRIDPDALEQVLLNLAVNARDAMPGGGTLTIKTANATVDPMNSVAPGEYVEIAVIDTGTGMDAATQAQIFEPFFTTKEQGRGTGLGLATCYGIVHQAGGLIQVDSALGEGTTFHVLLPRIEEQAEARNQLRDPENILGNEVILIAEDDEQVRKIAARSLSLLGYTVIEAADGEEALEQYQRRDVGIDLLLTDIVMPRLGGKALAERLRATRPTLPILFMTGHTTLGTVFDDPESEVLEKPFTPRALAQKVRRLLDARAPHVVARA